MEVEAEAILSAVSLRRDNPIRRAKSHLLWKCAELLPIRPPTRRQEKLEV